MDINYRRGYETGCQLVVAYTRITLSLTAKRKHLLTTTRGTSLDADEADGGDEEDRIIQYRIYITIVT
jgi:hypothetical protein